MSTDYTGPALVITAFGTQLVALIALFMNGRQGKKTHAIAVQIDAAVNGKGPGKPTISEEVTTILDKQEADAPSEPVETNGRAALVPMMKYLTGSIEELRGEVAALSKVRSGDSLEDRV